MAERTEMLDRREPDGSLVYPDGVPKGNIYAALKGKQDKWRPVINALEEAEVIAVMKDGTTDRITLKDGTEVV